MPNRKLDSETYEVVTEMKSVVTLDTLDGRIAHADEQIAFFTKLKSDAVALRAEMVAAGME